ncbi:MAG: RdgB/HAM1 family non-canonical purine NTP pyrophosphatase [Anaerolinea sp.]|nr:RdgB/HAM1 family non-canonical purine NTP pyrophosphatase [Anaerolinea sp.]
MTPAARPTLLIASTNAGKLREYDQLLADLPFTLINLKTLGLDGLEVDEPYLTFAENAVHKARTYARASGLLTLADDSGLIIDALDGRPGVHSARYAPTAEARIARVLHELEDIPDDRRTARFVCVIAVADPRDDSVIQAEGRVEGRIARIPGTGTTGFGYDPIFIPAGYSVPMSDVTPEIKNAIDHRGSAARAIRPQLIARFAADRW